MGWRMDWIEKLGGKREGARNGKVLIKEIGGLEETNIFRQGGQLNYQHIDDSALTPFIEPR